MARPQALGVGVGSCVAVAVVVAMPRHGHAQRPPDRHLCGHHAPPALNLDVVALADVVDVNLQVIHDS